MRSETSARDATADDRARDPRCGRSARDSIPAFHAQIIDLRLRRVFTLASPRDRDGEISTSAETSHREKRWNRLARPVDTSWRVDETCVSIRGRWHYLYRAVDKHGKTVDFLLRRDRGIAAAQAFFRKALISVAPRLPRKITLDGHVPSRRALWLLRHEHPCWRNVTVPTNRYLNNVIEQDHRAVKRRCASMAGFKSFANASIAIAGIELAHRIRKRQFILGRNRPPRGWSLKQGWAIALT